MSGKKLTRAAILDQLRPAAHAMAYVIAVVLAAVWITSALASFSRPLFDLGKARVGDAIMAFAGMLHLSPHGTLELAHMLVGLKLLLGTFLLIAVLFAIYGRVRRRSGDDDMLDVGLLLSAIASIVAAAPLAIEGEALRGLVGELMLCVIANGLAAFARGAPHPAARLETAPTPAA